jgi:hypothetical protein
MQLFTLAMIEHTVDCTDYYVRNFGNYTTKKRWTDLVPDELLCVIGIVIFMGLVQLPSQRDYWKPESKGITLPIRNYMSYDRFTSIVRNLTHTTKEKKDQPKYGEPGFDKLWRTAEHPDNISRCALRLPALSAAWPRRPPRLDAILN